MSTFKTVMLFISSQRTQQTLQNTQIQTPEKTLKVSKTHWNKESI